MTLVLKSISFFGLALTVAPAFFVFAGLLTWSEHAVYMLIGTALWFLTAPFWMHGGPKREFWKRRRPV